MEAIKKSIVEFFKKIREGPPKPKNTGNCVHCGRPYVLPEKPSCKECGRPYGADTPLVAVRQYDGGFVEITFRYPETWKAEIIRHYPEGKDTRSYLNFCEYCFWMNPRFASLRISEGCSIHYVWMDEQGKFYEVYEFGKDDPEKK